MKIIQIADQQFIDDMEEEDIISGVNQIYKKVISDDDHDEMYIVVVCGDIIEGTLQDEKKEEAFNNALVFYRQLNDRFIGSKFKLLIVPGNHDIINKSLEKFDDFCSNIVDYKNKFEDINSIGIRVDNINYILSSSVIEKDYKKPKIDCSAIKDNCLDKYNNIIVAHHEVKYDEKIISNKDDLLKVIDDCDINFYLHGHTHKGFEVYEESGCTFIGAKRCFEADWDVEVRNPSFNLLISGNKGIKKAYDYECDFRNTDSEEYKIKPIYPDIDYPDVKKKYSYKGDYIERTVKLIKDDIHPDAKHLKNKGLFDILKHNKNAEKGNRIVLLAEAGVGKTKELEYLAYQLYKDELTYPYLISLRDYVDKDIKDSIPQDYIEMKEHLYLLFDGYDEIAVNSKTIFERNLRSYCKEYPLTNVLITSRDHFYKDKFDKFMKCKLEKLKSNDIQKYIESKNIDYDNFIEKVRDQKLHGFLEVPFYLKHLVSIFEERECLPKSNDLLEELVNYSVKSDESKFINSDDILEEKYYIADLLSNIAFAIQMLGQIFLSEKNYHKLINADDRKLLMCRGIWDVDTNTNWLFTHNNFREYLAAKYLSNLTFDKIKDYIFYNRKLLDMWVNTIGYLLSMNHQEEIIKLLIEYNDSSLLKIEKDKILEKDRLKVFKYILESCKNEFVWISTNGYDAEEIASFVSCKEAVEFLISQIEEAEHYKALSNSIGVLSAFTGEEGLYGLDNEVANSLTEVCVNSDTRSYEIHDAIYALANLKLFKVDITSKLIELFSMDGSSEKSYSNVRIAMYHYLKESNNVDRHIEFYLYGMDCVYKGLDRTEDGAMTMEAFYLKESLINIKTYTSNDIMLGALVDKYSKGHMFNRDDIFETLVDNAIELFKKEKKQQEKDNQYLSYFKHYLKDNKISYGQNTRFLKKFFEVTKTLKRACDDIIEEEKDDADNMLILLFEATLDESLFEYYINEFLFGKLKGNEFIERVIKRGRNYIKKNDNLKKKVIEEGKAELLENEFDYDVDSVENQTQALFDSLFDEEKFKELIKELINIYGDNDIKINQLLHLEFSKTRNRADLRKLKIYLANYFGRREEEGSIAKVIEEYNFEKFQIYHIYRMLTQESNMIKPKDYQIKFIKEYFNDKVQNEDFKNVTNNGVYLIFFMLKFEFSCSQEILLDMLMVPQRYFQFYDNNKEFGTDKIDFSNKPFGYIEIVVDDNEMIKGHVIGNIKDEKLNGEVLRSHLMYCKKHKIDEAVDLATKVCVNSEESNYYKFEAVKYLIEIKNIKYVLEKILYHIDDKQLIKDIIRLGANDATPEFVKYTEEYYKSDDSDWDLISSLIKMNSKVGLDAYYDMIKKDGLPKRKDNSISPREQLTEDIGNISNIKHLDWAIDLLKLRFIENIQDNGFYKISDAIYSMFSNMSHYFGSKRKGLDLNNYKKVKGTLSDMKETYSDNLELIGFCNTFISRHDQTALMLEQKTYTIEEVKKIIGSD